MKNKAFYFVTILVLATSLGVTYLFTSSDSETEDQATPAAQENTGIRIP